MAGLSPMEVPVMSDLDKAELSPAVGPQPFPEDDDFFHSRLPLYWDQITRGQLDVPSLGRSLIDVTDTTEMIRKAYATKSELR